MNATVEAKPDLASLMVDLPPCLDEMVDFPPYLEEMVDIPPGTRLLALFSFCCIDLLILTLVLLSTCACLMRPEPFFPS